MKLLKFIAAGVIFGLFIGAVTSFNTPRLGMSLLIGAIIGLVIGGGFYIARQAQIKREEERNQP